MQQSHFPDHILYGADYNPEQWPEEVWLEDMRLMKQAGVTMVSVNIFSWSMLEPAPGQYHFEQLDKILDLLQQYEIAADLATATASPPTWMSRLYPDMLPQTREGLRLSHGSRQSYCPNSPDYRRTAAELVRELATRYRQHPAVKLWHINNEIGNHVSACYCDTCAAAFRDWLRQKYQSLDGLNVAWTTTFWSQLYRDWEDILPPRLSAAAVNPSQTLDYWRFMSDSLLGVYLNEADILREITPEIPLTTNFIFETMKPLDLFKWAKHVDIVSIDHYPHPTQSHPWQSALGLDLMRSLKKAPYLVMEQSPNQVNWRPQNPQKRPGQLYLQNMQYLAHGADGLLYFQWRQSFGGGEKFHSAMVPHGGGDKSRVYRQVAGLGADLQKMSETIIGSRQKTRVAILMDWDNWWDVEYLPGPSDRLHYWEIIQAYYRALYSLNIAVDIIFPEEGLNEYRLVVAPLLHLLQPGLAQKLERFVEQGGTFVTSFFSGIVDQHDHVVLGGYPGELRKLLGIWVEEFDPWTEEMTNEIQISEGSLMGSHPCTLWGELIHLEGAEALGTFVVDYYADGPALTKHRYGQGATYYLASQPGPNFMRELFALICNESGIEPVLRVPEGIEVTCRQKESGQLIYFLLNHNDQVAQVELPSGKFQNIISGERLSGPIRLASQSTLILVES